MQHRLADPASTPGPYAEAIARLANIRRSLKLADAHGGGPAADHADQIELRSTNMIGAATAGLEALAAVHKQAAPAEASRAMVDQIRRELAEISGIVLA